MSPLFRWMVRWARTVHLYLTLFALGLLLFFAATGFMLNHESWFSPAEPHTDTKTGTIPPALLTGPDKLGIVELLRAEYGAVGPMSSFEEDRDQLRVEFKRPGTQAEAVIRRDDGAVEVTVKAWGLNGFMMDLHRGKDVSRPWHLVIDFVAVVYLILAATGLTMWWSLKGRGRYGLAVIAVGVVLSVAVVLAFELWLAK
ncbi:MAG: PepSY-associated TM helix domain-containing protein [Gemmataceae bacterium]